MNAEGPGPAELIRRPARRLGQLSKPQIAILFVAWLIAIGIGYQVFRSTSSPAQVTAQATPVTVTRGTITATINAAGSVVSTKQAKLTFGASGTIKDILVNVGDTVKAGQPMAKLDTTNLEIALAQAQSNLNIAQLQLQQLKTGATPEERAAAQSAYDSALAKYNQIASGPTQADIRAAEQSVASAQANLLQAQSNLATLQAKPNPDDVKQAEIALEQAKDSLYSTQINRDATCGRGPGYQCDAANAQVMASEMSVQQAQLKLNIAKKPASPDEIAAAQKTLESAQAALDTAQAKLAQLKAGPSPADLSSAKSTLDTAKANLIAKTNGPSPEDVALAEEKVKQAQASLQQAQLNLNNATISAPFDGVVASIGANVGEQIGSGTAMFTLIDPHAVRVDVTVAETDITKISIGKPASISFDALPNQSFQGTVIAISPTATVQQGVVNYLVSISFDPGNSNLPAGLTASANIITDQKDNVLLVPNRAIRLSGRNRVVDLLVNGKEETRQVQIGMSNDQFTEITAGLNEGDQVLIRTTTSTSTPRIGGMPGMGGSVMIRSETGR